MKQGTIIFTKKATQLGDGFAVEGKTNPGFELISVVIGARKIKDKLPNDDTIMCLIGETGYVPSGLIEEVFGEEGSQKISAAFKAKYYKPENV